MSELKGIDVSSYQGKPDWSKVKKDGVNYAILRIHQRSGVDSSFEYNYNECIKNKIPIGGYKFSYATTVAEAEKEAEDTLKVLNGRKLDYPVFYDLEWSTQRSLGAAAIEKITLAFMKKIKKAGYKIGIYCNVDWYNNVLTDKLRKYDLWISRYPYDDTGVIQERLRPTVGIAWQYSSKGRVNGINGNVDMNVFYKDYSSNNSNQGGDKPMGITKEQAINTLIKTAENEVGYLEKRSNSQLDNKTANAGQNNYTKYWRDLKPSYQGQPWCAVFVSWIMYKTFGLETAKKLLKHTSDFPYVYCPTLGARFTKYANPEKGDVVIFYRNGTFAHTGIVTRVQGDRFWTIEGNTSGGSTIIANGGGVCAKSYYNSNLPGTKFCRPDYSIVNSINDSSTTTPSDPGLINKPLNKTTKWKGVVTADSLNVRTQPTTEASTCSFSPVKKDTVLEVCDSINDWYYIKYNGKYGFVSSKYVSKTVSKPSYDKWVGCCYKPSTTVFKTSVGTNPLTEYPKLRSGNLVDIIDETGDRYKVVINKKYKGYVSKEDIKDPDKKYPFMGKVVTNGGTLNLRKSPVTGTVVTEIPNGSDLAVKSVRTQTPDGSRWYEVKYKKYTGYVSGQYVKKA